jgi:hypothetical protein
VEHNNIEWCRVCRISSIFNRVLGGFVVREKRVFCVYTYIVLCVSTVLTRVHDHSKFQKLMNALLCCKYARLVTSILLAYVVTN